MQVLFVCYGNVGRSQVAEAHFQRISTHYSASAGTGVDEDIAIRNAPGRRLNDVPGLRSVDYIRREFGVDLSDRERRQLTPEMVERANMVIVINEKENWPDYLQEGGKVIFWDIPDPGRLDDGSMNRIFGRVRQLVDDLVKEIG